MNAGHFVSSVLVTGGAGFIGSHLTDELLRQGQRTIVLDDLSSGHLDNLPDHPLLEFERGDIRDDVVLAKLATKYEIHTVYHLAAIASVTRSIENPLWTHSVNTEGSLRLALWAERSLPSLRRFVFASSAAVYGDVVPVPVSEEVAGRPDSPYGLEKAATERYLDWLHRSRGFPSVSARFFNVYGPRQDPSSPYSGVLSLLAASAHAREGFVVDGDGEQTRDFIYVEDVVSGLRVLGEHADATGGVFNVGTGAETSINDVVRTVQRLAGGGLVIRHGPPRQGDIRHSKASASKLRELGWTSTWSIQDGLRSLLRSHRT